MNKIHILLLSVVKPNRKC